MLTYILFKSMLRGWRCSITYLDVDRIQVAESLSLEDNARRLFRQLLEAISFLHSSKIVHRDLKPNNILILEDGESLKLTDFNVAKFFEGEYKDAQKIIPDELKMYTYTGTLAFSAPEILECRSYTEKVDLWSAGCVLYTMLCGSQPFFDP